MSITSDEINYLIYRYLQENGFLHTAFCFENESLFPRSSVSQIDVPPGALITFLQKGLEYIGIEENICDDGTVKVFERNYSLLSPFVCDAIAINKKDKRRYHNNLQTSQNSDSMQTEDSRLNQNDNNQNNNYINDTTDSKSIELKTEGDSRWLQLQGHSGDVFHCVWNPVTPQLASGSADGTGCLWGLWELPPQNWGSENLQTTLKSTVMPHTQVAGERFKDITTLSWSHDGKRLATGCYDGTARIWDEFGVCKLVLNKHVGPIFALKWNPASSQRPADTLLLSGGFDNLVIVWNPDAATAIYRLNQHTAAVLDVDWKDGNIFATCSSDSTIHVYNTELLADRPTPSNVLTGHTDEINVICWSPDGSMIASCSDDFTAKVWLPERGLLYDLSGHSKEVYTVKWSPSGSGSKNMFKKLYLCTASFDGTARVGGG